VNYCSVQKTTTKKKKQEKLFFASCVFLTVGKQNGEATGRCEDLDEMVPNHQDSRVMKASDEQAVDGSND